MVTTASSAASGRRLYAATRALASASSSVSTEIPLSRAIWPRASRNSKFVLLIWSSPSHFRRCRSRTARALAGAPLEDRPHPLRVVVGQAKRTARHLVTLEGEPRLVGGGEDPPDPAHLGAVGEGPDRDRRADRPGEVLGAPEAPLEARARDVERVATRARVEVVEGRGDDPVGLGQGVEVDAAGAVHEDVHLVRADLEVHEVETGVSQKGVQRVV